MLIELYSYIFTTFIYTHIEYIGYHNFSKSQVLFFLLIFLKVCYNLCVYKWLLWFPQEIGACHSKCVNTWPTYHNKVPPRVLVVFYVQGTKLEITIVCIKHFIRVLLGIMVIWYLVSNDINLGAQTLTEPKLK